ncbi:selenocysteine-specific translation elongation factor [Micractinium conductrix]|uniref:Selenocysteine-specific translation elongation factor n=1 Tax=Micractinium conductrix TaxID=554055 RepID=A0A2P6VDR1_9CHLO|nr:selenocysteine-specific translation elongation factor [Micractinium conductrix]|eukprot:PSC72217.1 selenocysteine-specific translation elongation factor [Micractinium conductrix]
MGAERTNGRAALFWGATLAALLLPLSLLRTVGLAETWEAFDRYSAALQAFPEHHQFRVPATGDAVRDYAALGADLAVWQADAAALYERVSGMAVAGQLSSGETLQLTFGRVGSDRRKRGFYAQRDGAILAYLALSVAAHKFRWVPLNLLVLILNLINLAVCWRLKELTDALAGVALDQLADAQQALLALPLEAEPQQLAAQAAVLGRLRAMTDAWGSCTLGYTLAVPWLGTLSLSITLMASLAAATTARCAARVVRGLTAEAQVLLGRHALPQAGGPWNGAAAAAARTNTGKED